MRVIIIEPYLKNQSGHHYFYTSAVQSELKNRGILTIVLGNIQADKNSITLDNFYPCLTETASKAFANVNFIIKLISVYKEVKLLADQLKNFFIKDKKISIQSGDIFFIPTIQVFEFLALGKFLKSNWYNFVNKDIRIIFLLRFRYIRNSVFYSLFFAALYKFIYEFYLIPLRKKIVFYTDTELLKREYERLLNTEFKVCPIPVYNLFLQNYTQKTVRRVSSNENKIKKTISFVGGTRYNKGFDIFVEMVHALTKEIELSKKIYFLIHIDLHKQMSVDMIKTQNAINKINNIPMNSIRIVNGILPLEDYYALLDESDIVVLPYRKEGFKSSSSNILVETIIFGKVPVVSSNTWMAYELSKNGLNDLIFVSENLKSLLNVLELVIFNYENYQEKIKPLQAKWKQFHNSSKLVDMLLSS